MYPPPVALQAPSASTVTRANPAAPTRRAMRPRGDSFTMDFLHVSFTSFTSVHHLFIASFAIALRFSHLLVRTRRRRT